MRAGYLNFAVCAAFFACASPVHAATPQPVPAASAKPAPAQISPAPAKPAQSVVAIRPDLIVTRYDHWTAADERAYSEFIQAIGDSGCRTVNTCLHDPANPFRASDPDVRSCMAARSSPLRS